MNKLKRVLRHLLTGRWQVLRRFPRASLRVLEAATRRYEATHRGELRFAVEAALEWSGVLRGKTAHDRALALFSQLRIWDTEQNSGVLIYLLLADRRVEIIADRGIHKHVGTSGWAAICREMEVAFRAGQFEQGVLLGLERISALLAQHFPANGDNPNELSDSPVCL